MMPNSLKYIVFLGAAALAHAAAPKKWRNALLLAGSWLFYLVSMADCFPLLVIVTAGTFGLGLAMEKWPRRKKAMVAGALIVCFGLLFVYKYLAFAGQVVSRLLGITLELPQLIQPLGISFYLFAVTGYLIDIYRGAKAERNFVDYALMVSFFPAVMSGPIARSKHLLPQLKGERRVTLEKVKLGITRFLIGLAKKMLLADTLSALVAAVYGDVAAFTGTQVLFAALAYSMQIYCDFSSYSDMAVGAGMLFGIRLAENFDTPYFAQSIQELWRRWHISLSTWFRDYLYFPLGGSRKGALRTNLNLMIVFAVSGLWHGAATQYLVWGLLHGGFQVAGRLVRPWTTPVREKLDGSFLALPAKWLRIGWTFLLTNIAWVFFRADSVSHAVTILKKILTFGPLGELTVFGFAESQFVVLGVCLAALFVWDLFHKKYDLPERIAGTVWLRYAVWTVLILAVLCFGSYGSGYNASEFVYFQF